jgi:tRNA threonylcarbamoyladenosine biosynthesis protein TsaB
MEPTILAFDTSTEQMALALLWPGGRLTRSEPGGAAASGRLIPAAMELMSDVGLVWSQLDGIGFAAGPGAFTGLRTSCAVAQGLGLGLDRPLLALDSLMLVAEDALTQAAIDDALWVAVDARMDEAYAAAYRLHDDRWQVLEPPALYTLPALAARWESLPPAWVAGNATAAFGARLPTARARCLPRQRDRGEALAALARRAWSAGATVAPDAALPAYLRDKVALTTQERMGRATARA